MSRRLNDWSIALSVIAAVGWTMVGLWPIGLLMFANLLYALYRRDQITREGG